MTVTSGTTYHHFSLNFHLNGVKEGPVLLLWCARTVDNNNSFGRKLQSQHSRMEETHKNICTDENTGTYQRDIDGLVPLAAVSTGWVSHVQDGIGPSDRTSTSRQLEMLRIRVRHLQ
jgi:hypothetical protein